MSTTDPGPFSTLPRSRTSRSAAPPCWTFSTQRFWIRVHIDMVLLCGIPSETPLALVSEKLKELGVFTVMFNQRRFAETELSFELTGSAIHGALHVNGTIYSLQDFRGVYTRLMDDRLLPELRGEPSWSPRYFQCRNLHDVLSEWQEIADARVVNRSGPQGSNFSKPYQAQLIQAHGFAIPDTLITNDPELVQDFLVRHGRVIYKSISGIRSIVQSLRFEDLPRLERIRWCPVQFQAFVDGQDVRVHTIGSEVFATAIGSSATDYRYAHLEKAAVLLQPFELPDDLAEHCIELTRALGLDFAGIDLRLRRDGEAVCFEVNPSPAFSYYELNTGQPIARAVAQYLSGT